MDCNNYNKLFMDHMMSAHVVIDKVKCDKHFQSLDEYCTHLMTLDDSKYKHKLFLEKLYSKMNFNGFSENFKKHVISAHVEIDCMTSQSKICKQCNEMFPNEEQYNLHLIKHVKKKNGDVQNERFIKRFECNKCDMRFVQKSTLNAHASVHDPFPHNCHCGIGFYIKADLLRHQELVHPTYFKETLEKLTLRKQRALKNEFWVPIINYNGPKIVEVEVETSKPKGPRLKAELVVKSKVENRRRKINHTSKNIKGRHPCSYCGKTFPYVCVRKIHERVHTGEKPYGCDLCGKRFNQSATLKTHLNRHAGVKNCACDICGKEFLGKGNMENHRRIHTGDKPHKCTNCGKAFSDPSALARHERTHSGVKPYACRFCGMKFSDISGRIMHEKRHIGKKEFKCDICQKEFYEMDSLRKHVIAVHSGLKKYECAMCPKKYSLKQYLALHMKTSHSGKRSSKIFECDDSSKTKERGYMRRSHINKKEHKLREFQCDTCHLMFSSKKLISEHIMSKHSNAKCGNCSKTFCSSSELEKHNLQGCFEREICPIKIPTEEDLRSRSIVH